jgi:hypothetical protein
MTVKPFRLVFDTEYAGPRTLLKELIRERAHRDLDKNSFESKFASLCLDDHFTGALCSETKKNC